MLRPGDKGLQLGAETLVAEMKEEKKIINIESEELGIIIR